MLFTSAFSSLSQPTARSMNTRSTHNTRSTQLYEQPVNLKQLLGTASPAAMQKYNLLPETISDGFTAQIVTRVAKSTEESTDVLLAPKNSKDHFIDTVRVEIPLPLDSPPYGLGIELLEVEGGGREDGLGIVIVQGLVPGGNAERALGQANDNEETIMQGDSISAVELLIRRTGRSSAEEQTDVLSARTECLGYDATVEAIGNLLSSLEDSSSNNNIEEATMVLTLRRLRRRPQIQVKLHYPPSQNLPPETIKVQLGDNLRMSMLQKGVKLNDPQAQRYDGKPTGSGNCGSGGLCRTCAVSVMRGGELLSPPKQNEKKMLEDTPRWRLACKSWVGYEMKEGEISIQVNPRQW